jgi:hypothetical protein
MRVSKVHYFAYDCLVLGGKINSHGLPCVLMGFLFLFLITQTLEGHVFLFFTHFELFKRQWVHLLALYTLSLDPINK